MSQFRENLLTFSQLLIRYNIHIFLLYCMQIDSKFYNTSFEEMIFSRRKHEIDTFFSLSHFVVVDEHVCV